MLNTNLKGALVAEYFFVADPMSGQLKYLNFFEVLIGFIPATVVSLPKVVTRGGSEYTAKFNTF